MGKMGLRSYEQMVEENIEWFLENTEHSVERMHILDIIR